MPKLPSGKEYLYSTGYTLNFRFDSSPVATNDYGNINKTVNLDVNSEKSILIYGIGYAVRYLQFLTANAPWIGIAISKKPIANLDLWGNSSEIRFDGQIHFDVYYNVPAKDWIWLFKPALINANEPIYVSMWIENFSDIKTFAKLTRMHLTLYYDFV
jgi:hypothetical protein